MENGRETIERTARSTHCRCCSLFLNVPADLKQSCCVSKQSYFSCSILVYTSINRLAKLMIHPCLVGDQIMEPRRRLGHHQTQSDKVREREPLERQEPPSACACVCFCFFFEHDDEASIQGELHLDCKDCWRYCRVLLVSEAIVVRPKCESELRLDLPCKPPRPSRHRQDAHLLAFCVASTAQVDQILQNSNRHQDPNDVPVVAGDRRLRCRRDERRTIVEYT